MYKRKKINYNFMETCQKAVEMWRKTQSSDTSLKIHKLVKNPRASRIKGVVQKKNKKRESKVRFDSPSTPQ